MNKVIARAIILAAVTVIAALGSSVADAASAAGSQGPNLKRGINPDALSPRR